MSDIIVTDSIYIFPCMLKWFYRLKIKRDIIPIPLKNSLGKKGTLYQHSPLTTENRGAQAILILHGRYSHPFVMLHLCDLAKEAQMGPVFSLYVNYGEVEHDPHRLIIKQAVDFIETTFSPKGIILAGHSLGGLEAAYQAFVEKDRRIQSVISIAGRLKVVETVPNPCRESLRPTVNKVYQAIQAQPEIPLFQIVAGIDWNSPLESTLVRKDEGFYSIVEDAMHFNILFHPDMHKKFVEYLIYQRKF